MDLYSFNCGDLYKSNYEDPSIELCSSKNRITEIHKSNYGDPLMEQWISINWIMATQNWIMEIYKRIAEFNNELWNFIFR